MAASSPAVADRFSAAEIGYDNALFSNFNLVTLGNLNATASVNTDGRVFVGGNLSASIGTTYGACNSAASCAGNLRTDVDASGANYGALTVFGNVAATLGTVRAGYNTSAANRAANGNTAYIRGSASGTFQANGTSSTGTDLNVGGSVGGLTVNAGRVTTTSTGNSLNFLQKTGSQSNASYPAASAAAVFPFSSTGVTNEVTRLAQGIAALPGSPGVTAQTLPPSTTGLFTANADWSSNGLSYGVVTTSLTDLARQTGLTGINNGANAATFVIVTGNSMDSTDASYNSSLMLPNLASYASANKVIFEFVDAKVLKFAGSWNGSILAPLATVSTMGGTLNGTVIVNALTQSQAITSTNLFAGDLTGLVPEPASLALFGLGAGAAVLVRRRRVSARG